MSPPCLLSCRYHPVMNAARHCRNHSSVWNAHLLDVGVEDTSLIIWRKRGTILVITSLSYSMSFSILATELTFVTILALDVTTGSIFCAPCDDLVYQGDLESVYNHAALTVQRKRMQLKSTLSPSRVISIHGRKINAISLAAPKLSRSISSSPSSHSSIIPCQGQHLPV